MVQPPGAPHVLALRGDLTTIAAGREFRTPRCVGNFREAAVQPTEQRASHPEVGVPAPDVEQLPGEEATLSHTQPIEMEEATTGSQPQPQHAQATSGAQMAIDTPEQIRKRKSKSQGGRGEDEDECIATMVEEELEDPWLNAVGERWIWSAADLEQRYDARTGLPLDFEQSEAGRRLEEERLQQFDVYEEITIGQAKAEEIEIIDAGWVEDQREGFVRSRVVGREYRTMSQREDLFSATPELVIWKMMVDTLSTDSELIAFIADISNAYFHAECREKLAVRPPRSLRRPGIVWRLKKALHCMGRVEQARTFRISCSTY